MADKRLKYLNRKPAKKSSASYAKNLRVKISSNGRISFEELTHALQKAFAQLEGRGVLSVENCSLYFAPRSQAGAPMVLKDEKGKEQDVIDVYVSVPATQFSKATAA